eukprot:TRINITY_DN2566_c0_g1_i1.p1 TRINITY_DN2566_c0_g1~~TRINITY_DN2566_c0_g1_i1.p1  ORF type:complete len:137 (+),score=27.37 TRINITY_DN2566_c0_g1_i1:70-480(+)
MLRFANKSTKFAKSSLVFARFASSNNNVVNLGSSEAFQKVVLENSKPVLLDCYATWCGPCKRLTPVLEKMANDANGSFVLVKLDVDEHGDLAGKLGVNAVPTVFAVKDGKIKEQFSGMLPEPNIKAFMKTALGVEL